jgi:hypothetical protein
MASSRSCAKALLCVLALVSLATAASADSSEFLSVDPPTFAVTAAAGETVRIYATFTNVTPSSIGGNLLLGCHGIGLRVDPTSPPVFTATPYIHNDVGRFTLSSGETKTVTYSVVVNAYHQPALYNGEVDWGWVVWRSTEIAGYEYEFYRNGEWVPTNEDLYNVSSPFAHRFSLEIVPEPSSMFALLCGIGGLGGFIWRRRSA